MQAAFIMLTRNCPTGAVLAAFAAFAAFALSLDDSEIALLTAWADNDAPESCVLHM